MTSAQATTGARHCRVLDSGKLDPRSGGAEFICSEVERALNAAVHRAHYEITVRVISNARLSAAGTFNGRKLAEQNIASSDRELTAAAIKRFARSIAEAAKAAR